MNHLKVTLVQMRSTDNHQGNIAVVQKIVQQSGDSNLIALPEASGMMNKNYKEARKSITTVEKDPFIKTCQQLAKEAGKWIHIGSTPVREHPRVSPWPSIIKFIYLMLPCKVGRL